MLGLLSKHIEGACGTALYVLENSSVCSPLLKVSLVGLCQGLLCC